MYCNIIILCYMYCDIVCMCSFGFVFVCVWEEWLGCLWSAGWVDVVYHLEDETFLAIQSIPSWKEGRGAAARGGRTREQGWYWQEELPTCIYMYLNTLSPDSTARLNLPAPVFQCAQLKLVSKLVEGEARASQSAPQPPSILCTCIFSPRQETRLGRGPACWRRPGQVLQLASHLVIVHLAPVCEWVCVCV